MSNIEEMYEVRIVERDTNTLFGRQYPKDCVVVSATFNGIRLVIETIVTNEAIEATNGGDTKDARKLMKKKLKDILQDLVNSLKDDGEDQGKRPASAEYIPYLKGEE